MSGDAIGLLVMGLWVVVGVVGAIVHAYVCARYALGEWWESNQFLWAFWPILLVAMIVVWPIVSAIDMAKKLGESHRASRATPGGPDNG